MRRFKPIYFLISGLSFVAAVGCFRSAQSNVGTDSFIIAPPIMPNELKGDLLYFDAGKKHVFRYSFRNAKATQITNAPAQYYSPRWSPDKKQIVFSSNVRNPANRAPRLKTWEIFIANNDDSRLQQVTHNMGAPFNPTFLSPGRLLFTSFTRAGTKKFPASICAIGSDGKNFRRLATGENPSPSANGRKIAFVAQSGPAGEIFSMNADGSGRRRLTFNAWREQSPVWSPDGQKIAFVSRQNNNFDICLMNADGSGQCRLTRSEAMETSPCFSPDGRKIAFNSGRKEKRILVMNLDGSNVQRLPLQGDIRYPNWR